MEFKASVDFIEYVEKPTLTDEIPCTHSRLCGLYNLISLFYQILNTFMNLALR